MPFGYTDRGGIRMDKRTPDRFVRVAITLAVLAFVSTGSVVEHFEMGLQGVSIGINGSFAM